MNTNIEVKDLNFENQKNKKIQLKKILVDRTSYKFRLFVIIGAVMLFIAIRILLFFAMPDYFIHVGGEIKCPNKFDNFSGICADISYPLQKNWSSTIMDFKKKEQFLVVSGKGIRNFMMSQYKEYIKIKYKYKVIPLKKELDTTPDPRNIRDEGELDAILKFDEKELMSEPYDFLFSVGLPSRHYRLEISLEVLDDENKSLEGFAFDIYKGNPKIIDIILIVRYVLFALSIITLIIFFINYIQTPKDYRTFEHNSILIKSICLILFNDPFIAIILLHPLSKFWSVVSVLLITQFVGILFYIWLRMANIYSKERSEKHKIFEWKQALYVFVIFALIMVSACIYNTDPELHPAYFVDNTSLFYYILLIVTAVFIASFWVYVLVLICKAISRFNQKISREKFFITFAVLCLILVVFNLLTGYYHHFALEQGSNISYFLGINCYIFILQILWRFVGGEITVEETPKNLHVKVEIEDNFAQKEDDYPNLNQNHQFELKNNKNERIENDPDVTIGSIDINKDEKKLQTGLNNNNNEIAFLKEKNPIIDSKGKNTLNFKNRESEEFDNFFGNNQNSKSTKNDLEKKKKENEDFHKEDSDEFDDIIDDVQYEKFDDEDYEIKYKNEMEHNIKENEEDPDYARERRRTHEFKD